MKIALLLWGIALWHAIAWVHYLSVCYIVGYDRHDDPEEEHIFLKCLLFGIGWIWPLTSPGIILLVVRKEAIERRISEMPVAPWNWCTPCQREIELPMEWMEHVEVECRGCRRPYEFVFRHADNCSECGQTVWDLIPAYEEETACA
jgi:hypothetical protein